MHYKNRNDLQDNKPRRNPPQPRSALKRGAGTVEWLSLDDSGGERATRHLQRVEAYERQKRVRSLQHQHRQQQLTSLDLARILRGLYGIGLLLTAVVVLYVRSDI